MDYFLFIVYGLCFGLLLRFVLRYLNILMPAKEKSVSLNGADNSYKPNCGDFFDITGMTIQEVMYLCDCLFIHGVSGYGVGIPTANHISGAVHLYLVHDINSSIKIYFFDAKITPANVFGKPLAPEAVVSSAELIWAKNYEV